jgi:carboxymethylenebutenolidase
MTHFGERDAGIPVAGVRKLEAAHPDVQVFLYAAGHGFNCSERASYDAAAAAQARERTLGFLRRHVG